MRPLRLVVSLAALGIVLAPSAALAHRMDVDTIEFPATDPTGLRLVVGYDTDEPAEEATVKLLDADDKVVAEGVTNERGVCRLPRPAPGTYTVTADDGAGHRCKKTFVVPGVEEPAPAAVATAPPNRWLRTAAGLGGIAAVTLVAWRVKRKATRQAV